MSKFELSSEVDSEKIFLVNLSDIEGRIDPVYYKLKHKYSFNAVKLSNLLNDVFQGQVQGTQEQQAIKVLKVKNLDLFGNIDFDDVTYTNDMNDRKILKKGDIITPFRGQTIFTNKFAFFDSNEIVTIDNNLGVIRLDSKKIIPKFFRYYISSKIGFNEILKNVGGAGIPALTKDIIANIDVPILSFKKQQTIIDIMDNAYLQKQQKEQEAKELLDSIDGYLLDELGITLPEVDNSLEKRIFEVNFSEISGWRFDPDYKIKMNNLENLTWSFPLVELKDIIIGNSQYGANETAQIPKSENDIRYIRITDIDELGLLKDGDWRTVSKIEEQYLLNFNDILFARSGSVGKCYIHKNMDKKSIFAGYLIRFVLNEEKINPDYLFFYCNSSIYRYWVSAIERPAVQSNINSEEYKSLKIPLPPIEKQNEIAGHIQAIRDKAKQLQDEAKKVLDEAKIEVEKLIL
ncbi:MAG: restriction endonuclease subunit S, partial [Campylobacterales bacterium]|nr:restriction endonuclease subunit S [Campylobacterales bacterium]